MDETPVTVPAQYYVKVMANGADWVMYYLPPTAPGHYITGIEFGAVERGKNGTEHVAVTRQPLDMHEANGSLHTICNWPDSDEVRQIES